jgi:hypothetical protein
MITFHIVTLEADKMVVPQHELPYWFEQAKAKEIAGVFADYYEPDAQGAFAHTCKYTQRIA